MSIYPDAPVARAAARAKATRRVSMSTRTDPEGSDTVEIATRRCPRLRVVWDLRELTLHHRPRLWSLAARLGPVTVHPAQMGRLVFESLRPRTTVVRLNLVPVALKLHDCSTALSLSVVDEPSLEICLRAGCLLRVLYTLHLARYIDCLSHHT